jgi:DMSO/TMAO reductase YedYZ molybdopterin-dependent catalytic subunit
MKARQSASIGLIIRQKEPSNLETPFDQVDSFLTPTELFYIRSHFPAPTLDLASYQLRIDGAVKNPFSLSYKELREMPSETRVATLECAGNGRVFLIPHVEGAQWELSEVGNAEWTGVPLACGVLRSGPRWSNSKIPERHWDQRAAACPWSSQNPVRHGARARACRGVFRVFRKV